MSSRGRGDGASSSRGGGGSSRESGSRSTHTGGAPYSKVKEAEKEKAKQSSSPSSQFLRIQPSTHMNYQQRKYADHKATKKAYKKEKKKKRKAAIALGEELPTPVIKTLENTRELDETVVNDEDDEIIGEEEIDEFASHYGSIFHDEFKVNDEDTKFKIEDDDEDEDEDEDGESYENRKAEVGDNDDEEKEQLLEQGDELVDTEPSSTTGHTSSTSAPIPPKIIITTNYHPTKRMFTFIADLLHTFPNSYFYERHNTPIKQMVEKANDKQYTDLLILNEDHKEINALTHIHLPIGPTAHFKLTNVECCEEIPNGALATDHLPEVILNCFQTRLGVRIGRMLGSLIHTQPQFRGRRVLTFHNQRDFIFFRHHRYVFGIKGRTVDEEERAQQEYEGKIAPNLNKKQKLTPTEEKTKKEKEKVVAKLQELGPRFTMKLKWLQHGTFDTEHGEYEWKFRRDMDTSRRRFYL